MDNPEYVRSRRTIRSERQESNGVSSSSDCSIRKATENFVLSFVLSNVDRMDVVLPNRVHY